MSSNWNCWCVMKVYHYYFQGKTKYIWATCMLKLPNVAQQNCLFLNKGNVFSLLWTAYSNTNVSNNCSYLKTICQCQNHLRKWSSRNQSPWQLLLASKTTISQSHLWTLWLKFFVELICGASHSMHTLGTCTVTAIF